MDISPVSGCAKRLSSCVMAQSRWLSIGRWLVKWMFMVFGHLRRLGGMTFATPTCRQWHPCSNQSISERQSFAKIDADGRLKSQSDNTFKSNTASPVWLYRNFVPLPRSRLCASCWTSCWLHLSREKHSKSILRSHPPKRTPRQFEFGTTRRG